ncbi:MAG: hypothetical protein K9N10_19995 [Deltaproteobacteria bacterium]|nr:hypothetical protein [Deltaproteobacteria bacterium]
MKIQKPIFKGLVWTLAFFLITAGIAQGAESCKGKCCQEERQPAGNDSQVRELSLNSKTPIERLLPSCHLPKRIDLHRVAASETAPCQDEAKAACCHLEKAETGIQALPVKGQFGGANRFFNAHMAVCIQPQSFMHENGTHYIAIGWVFHPRAAPVPLYLKNASFIC